MTIRRRLALAFLAILSLFALNIAVYFNGIAKRNASFEDLNQAVSRQLLVIDLQQDLSSLSDLVRNLNLLRQADLESARLDVDQAVEKTAELRLLAVAAGQLVELSQRQPGASRTTNQAPGDASSVTPSETGDSNDATASVYLTDLVSELEVTWSEFFRCLSAPPVDPLEGEETAADAVESTPPPRPAPLAPVDALGDNPLAGSLEIPDDGSCIDPRVEVATEVSTLLSKLARAERLRVEQARFHFAEVARVTNRRILLIFAISTLVAVVVALLFSAFLSRGLTALKTGAGRIGKGDLEHRIPSRGNDELSELATTFNDMSKNLLSARSKVEEARAAAEDANRAKSTFLANMSHELRTPMNAIIGYSEMLVEEAEDLEQKEFIPDLQRILAASNHLLALINDVLDLSKIEAGKMTLFLEDFTIESLIDDVASTIMPMVTKNSNELVRDLGPNLGSFRADETKVRQTLFNLLSNACKFTSDGTITLAVERYPTSGGDRFRFNVSDTGIGMSQEQMGRIFEEFTQADSSTTRKFGGTGLGLTISKRFCQLMGGDLTVASQAGQGTTFTVDLPVIVPNVNTPQTSTSSAVPSPGTGIEGTPNVNEPIVDSPNRATILVIDDDPASLDLTRRFLEKEEGYQVVTANQGQEGLRLAKELQPRAILLDIMMPQMDGWQVLSALQADPETHEIPVLMMSMLDEKDMGYALGATDYLNKPLTRQRLSSHLARLQSRPHGPGKLLVVDDDPAARDLLRRSCERDGWQVSEAENGLVALALVVETRPDLILLDLQMPQMDGYEFLQELRQNAEFADLPVVVVTAKDLDGEERLRLAGQVEAVLRKGNLKLKELVAELRRIA